MKKIALLLLIAVSACKYNEVPKFACDVSDPANNLPWLKERIHEIEQSSLRQYFRVEQVEYDGEIGFYVSSCCPLCSTMPLFYKCTGDSILITDPSKLVVKGVIWQPSDYSCLMN